MIKIPTRHASTSLAFLTCLGLAACGGGDGAPAIPLTQSEATDVVDSVNTGNLIVNDAMQAGGTLASLLVGLNGDTLRKVEAKCPGGGTYLVSEDTKTSAGDAVLGGESATITLTECRQSGRKTALTGTAVVKATQASKGSFDFSVSMDGFQFSYEASTTTYVDTLSGNYAVLLRAGDPVIYTVKTTNPLTASMANYPNGSFIRNGNFTLREVNATNEFFSDGHAVNLAYRTDFVGADAAGYSAMLTTAQPTRYKFGDTATVTQPGVFQIQGYKNAQIQVTVDSLTSATADVDFGANGTSDLNFNLIGAYFY